MIKFISGLRWSIFFFLIIGYSSVRAQSQPESSQKEQAPVSEPAIPQKKKSTTTEPDNTNKETVKAVPVAKDHNAKPARVGHARPNGARSSVGRPARSPRPTGRVVRPGRGQ